MWRRMGNAAQFTKAHSLVEGTSPDLAEATYNPYFSHDNSAILLKTGAEHKHRYSAFQSMQIFSFLLNAVLFTLQRAITYLVWWE